MHHRVSGHLSERRAQGHTAEAEAGATLYFRRLVLDFTHHRVSGHLSERRAQGHTAWRATLCDRRARRIHHRVRSRSRRRFGCDPGADDRRRARSAAAEPGRPRRRAARGVSDGRSRRCRDLPPRWAPWRAARPAAAPRPTARSPTSRTTRGAARPRPRTAACPPARASVLPERASRTRRHLPTPRRVTFSRQRTRSRTAARRGSPRKPPPRGWRRRSARSASLCCRTSAPPRYCISRSRRSLRSRRSRRS